MSDSYSITRPEQRLSDLGLQLRVLVRRESASRREIGLLLLEVRALLPHGEFLPWLEEALGWSHETARLYMRLAEWHLQNPNDLDFLMRASVSVTALCTLACGPDGARAEAVRLAQQGVSITCERAREIVRRERGLAGASSSGLPSGVQRLVDEGALGEGRAQQVAGALSAASPRVRALVECWGVSDPALVAELDRICRAGRETFVEIEATGCVPLPPPLAESVPLSAATLRDLRLYLEYAADEHRRAGGQAAQERRLDRVEQALNSTAAPVVVARSLEDMVRAPDDCLLLIAAGDLPSNALVAALDNHNYRLMTVVAARGDAPVPVDGEAVAARLAQYRVDDLTVDALGKLLGGEAPVASATPPATGRGVGQHGARRGWLPGRGSDGWRDDRDEGGFLRASHRFEYPSPCDQVMGPLQRPRILITR